ncbi:ATP-binding cassette domain-containing protein [Eubacterium aggregans]|uniref:ATP-binding cassette domain-containing protein n=1 Tax=Eubacterium aggregans TaxID=81409 RepID=UPI003F32BACA
MKVTNFSVSRKNKLFVNQFTYMFSNNYIYNLYGPNGSGKSTFAKALAGYLPYGGESEFKTSTIGIVSSYTNIPGEVSVKSVIQLLDHQTDLPKNIRLILYQRCGINSIIDRRHVSLLSDGEK